MVIMKPIILILIILCILTAVFLTVIVKIYILLSKVTEGDPIPEFKDNNSALMVIDVQEGLSGSRSIRIYKGYADQSESLIASVNKTIDKAVSAGIPVIYIYHEDTNPVIKFFTRSHMAKGTPAAAIDKRVKIVSDNLFNKDIMDGFTNEALHKFLTYNRINTLYMTGLDAQFCVYRTSLGAKKRGYDVNLIEDAVISSSVKSKIRALKKYKTSSINLITAKEFDRVHNSK